MYDEDLDQPRPIYRFHPGWRCPPKPRHIPLANYKPVKWIKHIDDPDFDCPCFDCFVTNLLCNKVDLDIPSSQEDSEDSPVAARNIQFDSNTLHRTKEGSDSPPSFSAGRNHSNMNNPYTTPKKKKSTTSLALVISPTPNKKRAPNTVFRSGILPTYESQTVPIGPYANGFQGTQTVLNPRAYGTLDAVAKSLANTLRVASGVLELTVACDPQETNTYNPPEAVSAIACTPQLLQYQDNADWLRSFGSAGVDIRNANVGTSAFLSPIVEQTMFHALRSVGVSNLDTMMSFLEPDGEDAYKMRQNPKCNILFMPIMLTHKMVSQVNMCNEYEFIRSNDGRSEPVYNTNYWKANVVTKMAKSTGGWAHFSYLEIGMVMPRWSIPEPQMHNHDTACQYMKENGPFVANSTNVPILTLKNAYSYHFVQNMKTALVAKARKAGFHPLFVLKNCYLQQTKFGVNNSQFSTIDKNPKSFLQLVGFTRGTEENGDLTIIVLENKNKQLLRINGN